MRRLSVGVLLLLGIAGCQSSPAPPVPTIVIASALSLSGDIPSLGAGQSHAIELAIEQQGHIGRFKLAYHPYDSGQGGLVGPIKGPQDVKQMIADARALGVISAGSSNGVFDAIPIANERGLAMLSPLNTNWCLTLASPVCNPQPVDLRPYGPNNYFRIAAADPKQAVAMARFAVKSLGVRRVAAFSWIRPFDPLTLSLFGDELRQDGGDLVYATNLSGDTTNFRPFLQEALSRGAEAIYAAVGQDDLCRVPAQMAGIFPPDAYFFGTDSMLDSPVCVQNAGHARIFVTSSLLDLEQSHDAAVQKVVAAYNHAYPHGPGISRFTFAAYDCALILIQAIKQAVDQAGGAFPKRSAVVDALAHSQFKGVIGSYSFDRNGDAVAPVMAMYEVKVGQWTYLQQIDAGPGS